MAQSAGGMLVLCSLEWRGTYRCRYSHKGPEHPSIAVRVNAIVSQVQVLCCENVVASRDACEIEICPLTNVLLRA